ncbi:MAG: hypothetical protein K2Y21_05770 [Phycisphaerales bacterium]|nr:hypothetical protein [Phycisphaerales bacterium]
MQHLFCSPDRVLVSLLLVLAAFSMSLVGGCASGASGAARVEAADLDRLTGTTWKGSLIYRDYQTNKPTAIETTLDVARVEGSETPRWDFRRGYPKEPHANANELIALNADGTMLGEERVVERAALPGGGVKIVTEQESKDNNKPALLRFVYTIDERSLRIVKLVRTGDEPEFERNRVELTR